MEDLLKLKERVDIAIEIGESYGDTEIIKRSTRSFLKTLCDFKILEPISSAKYHQLPKTALSTEQLYLILGKK